MKPHSARRWAASLKMEEEVYHIPALLPQAIEALDIKESGSYVDATYGGGGHSRAIVEHLGDRGHLYAFDQDLDAIERAHPCSKLTLIRGNFRFMTNFLRFHGVDKVDGILADLGVSFHHFDDPERGFSFRFDGPLDMRMNRESALTAARVVNSYSEERLADILYLYGEMKNSRRIAAAIVKARGARPIATVNDFVEVITPFVDRRQEKKDLARIFQALRIEVNGELNALQSLLTASAKALKPGGRLVVITYHSLEDRMVKNFMRTGNIRGDEAKDFYGRSLSPFKLITSKPIVADEAEVEANPRSRSAKMRVAQMI